MTYRLRKPLQVMPGDTSDPFFVEIKPGEIVMVEGNEQKSGQVNVLHNGQTFVAVVQDILERADVVKDE